MTPTPKSGSNGMPGRSCSRGTPASSTRSRGKAKVWDALRFVFLMGAPESRASGPEHCRRVQIAVSKLPSSPGNRTSAFGVWSSNQGMDQLGEGTSRRSLRSGYRSLRSAGDLIPETGRMWKCGVLVSGPGELAPECWFTLRSAGIQVPDDRLLRHRIHTDADFAGPAPGEVGVIPERSRRPMSGRCLCLSALGVMSTGTAATSLAPSATSGGPLCFSRQGPQMARQQGVTGWPTAPATPAPDYPAASAPAA